MAIQHKRYRTMHNEANSDFKIGDQVYIRGSYGIGDEVYEIEKITDSHDKELETIEYGSYLFEPDKEAIAIAILQELETGERHAYKINGNSYYDPTFIAVADVEAIKLENIDLIELANKLADKLKSATGINAKLTFTLSAPDKGMQYGKLVLSSNNVIEQAGILQLMLDSLTVDSWGSAVVYPLENKMGILLHFSYSHVDGGTNGHNFGSALYDFTTNNWTVELYKR